MAGPTHGSSPPAVAHRRPPQIRPRRETSTYRRPLAPRLLPSQSAKHVHRQTHPAHVRRHLHHRPPTASVGWDKLRAPTRSVGRPAPAHHVFNSTPAQNTSPPSYSTSPHPIAHPRSHPPPQTASPLRCHDRSDAASSSAYRPPVLAQTRTPPPGRPPSHPPSGRAPTTACPSQNPRAHRHSYPPRTARGSA